jgi:hypothetical protein
MEIVSTLNRGTETLKSAWMTAPIQKHKKKTIKGTSWKNKLISQFQNFDIKLAFLN